MTSGPCIAFTSVHAPYGWLGNMSPHPLTVEALSPWAHFAATLRLAGTWRTSEALFQAARFDDLEIREEIRACRSPMKAKMVARRYALRRVVEPRGEQDLAHMEQILRVKIRLHPDLRQQLGEIPIDAFIVEDTTRRGRSASNVFWGAMLINGEWVGENRLGHMWMKIRQELPDVATAAPAQINMFHRHDDRSVAAAAFNNNNNNNNEEK